VAGERLNSPYSLRPRPPTRPGSWSWAGASEIIYDARVPLHPLTAGFAEVAGAYERGRPEYAPAVVGAIAAELDIPAAGPVLDLAAGTGKLTRALLGVGLDVVAVEPQPELRELLAASVGSEHVREGLAEAIPLPDQSVAVVTVADAFHWFDHAVALAEIKRVLRPGGGLAVLSAVPDWSGASWAHEVGTLIAGMLTAHPQIRWATLAGVRACGRRLVGATRDPRDHLAAREPRSDGRLHRLDELGRLAAPGSTRRDPGKGRRDHQRRRDTPQATDPRRHRPNSPRLSTQQVDLILISPGPSNRLPSGTYANICSTCQC
jgi:SAM-dependent methyltransferase